MKLHGGYRQLALFLTALVLPSVALVALGLRIVSQERELAEKRALDKQKQTTSEVRHELLARLERAKLDELSTSRQSGANTANPAVMFAGWVHDGHLLAPWDTSKSLSQFRADIRQPWFASLIENGEAAEFAEKAFKRAIDWYADAAKRASTGTQRVFAQALLARALRAAGHSSEAEALDRKALSLSAEIVDEYGIPFAFQSALRLVKAGGRWDSEILDRARQESGFLGSRSPAQLSALRQVIEALQQSTQPLIRDEAATISHALEPHARRLDRVRALQSDFSALHLDPSTWQPYGDGDSWLVGISPPQADGSSLVVAVDLATIVGTIKTESGAQGSFRIVRDGDAGEALGEALPRLRVTFDALEDRELTRGFGLQRMYYLLSLGLVLAVTALGGYLVWRDIQRDLNVAQMRSHFVSSVTHELKTPLTAIRMFVDTLRFRRPEDQNTQDECLETISEESERLTRLVNNVLDFSRIERGQKTYQLQPVSLADVIATSVRAMQYVLSQEGFRLSVSLPDVLPPVFADRDAIEQAILNLLTNAMKYSGESRAIELRARIETGAAVIQVSDQGIGIPVDEQSRIFEKFYRASTPENRGIPGTGLGLALVAHIVRAHSGTIAVESSPGQGSTFTLRLPLAEARGAKAGDYP